MSAASAVLPEQEPTPEFNNRCTELLQRWQSGELPFKDAVQKMELLSREAQDRGLPANHGRAELLLGVMQGYRANLDASIRHFERARVLFEQAGNRRRMMGAILNLGESYRLKGNFSRARQLFRAAYEAAEEIGNPETQANAACNEGLMLLSTDHIESARAMLEKAFNLATQGQNTEQQLSLFCEIHHGLASVYLKTGQIDKAWKHALNALTIARGVEQPLMLGFANRAMGEVMSKLGALPTFANPTLSADPDDYYRAASEAFLSIKAEGEVARTMYAQALSLSTRGRGMTAARKLQQAMIIFTRLGMADDAAKAAHAQMNVLATTSSAF
jgi:tetratricopeptide (TPR) repeat protein